jgi:hypothetical protein
LTIWLFDIVKEGDETVPAYRRTEAIMSVTLRSGESHVVLDVMWVRKSSRVTAKSKKVEVAN